jgi:transposase
MAARGRVAMTDCFLLSDAQMRRTELFFSMSHGVPRVDDRWVISGIVFVIRSGLRSRDAPREYGPHKTIYKRFVRWSRLGVFNKTWLSWTCPPVTMMVSGRPFLSTITWTFVVRPPRLMPIARFFPFAPPLVAR